jgi:hypothetical protein
MSHHKLREDKTCLNCGNAVEDRFCSHCGQENVETRQSFGALIAHFLEDLTHYEGKFWRTMKYLLFRPAYLSKEFLAGKRISYLPPVRLYIFISFVTFLLPHLLPDFEEVLPDYTPEQLLHIDSLRHDTATHFTFEEDIGFIYSIPYRTMAEVDSAREARKGTYREMSWIEYWYVKRPIELQRYTPRDLEDKFTETIGKSMAKALFIYMPLFALILWLFHGKKRWMYFDHAIFTLHYFSFLLMLMSLLTVAFMFTDWGLSAGIIDSGQTSGTDGILILITFLSMTYYFYRSHRVMYEESWMMSLLKASVILVVNTILFAVIIFFTVMVTVAMIH